MPREYLEAEKRRARRDRRDLRYQITALVKSRGERGIARAPAEDSDEVGLRVVLAGGGRLRHRIVL